MNQISTARLSLRPLAVTDTEALYGMMSDHETMRYWSSSPWTTMAQAHEFVSNAQAQSSKPTAWLFGIEARADGVLVGMCTLFNLAAESRRAELGYLLDRRHWGTGLMYEATSALLSYGFRTLQLNRVEADVDPRNLGSVRLLERLGFVREGLLRARWIVSSEISDSAIYGILASQWTNAK